MLNLIITDTAAEQDWQAELKSLVTSPDELCDLLELDCQDLDIPEAALGDFSLRVPRRFLARMEKGNPRDPLLLQVLPRPEELDEHTGYSQDPLQELDSTASSGILHKYHGRVLLMPTSSCAIHCRYCFRRHFPYSDHIPSRAQWQTSLDYIREDHSISEVILSGGDPLVLSDRHFDWLLGELEAIDHLQRLRIHTRVPIMIPGRINSFICERLEGSRLKGVLVLHSNHANELDHEVASAMSALYHSGITLLNQSVLMTGVNDNAEALSELSERLHHMKVLPYYLHLPDKTRGTAHFDISLDRAHSLYRQLQATLPGYLVPRLVREQPGERHKTLIAGQ